VAKQRLLKIITVLINQPPHPPQAWGGVPVKEFC